MSDVIDLLTEAQRVTDDVRYHGRTAAGKVSAANWDRLGAVSDYLGQALAALDDAPPAPPVPPPDPPPVTRLIQPGGTGLVRLPTTALTIRCPNRTTPCAIALTLNGGALQSDEPVPQIVDADLVGLGFVEVEATYDYGSMAHAYASVLVALEWVYTNAAAIGGDTARVHGVGHSTGASLIALLGLRNDSPGFSGSMFLWSTAAATGSPLGAGPEQQMVATKYGSPPDQWFPANWLGDAKGRGVRVQVAQIHATDDTLVPYGEALQFAQRGQQIFAGAWQLHSCQGGHGATPAPNPQAQSDLMSVDRG